MKYEEIIECQFSTMKDKELHFHQEPEIIYLLDGELTVSGENMSHLLKKDDFLVANSNVRHEWHGSGDLLIGSIFINYNLLTEMFSGEQIYFLCDSTREKSEEYEKMRYYIRQIFNYYQTTEGQAVLLRRSISYQMLYLLTSAFIVKKGMSHYDSMRGISDERMSEILNYIMSHYQEQITLQELADKLYLSNAYLSKYIKRNFGLSFLKLVNNIRMEYAMGQLIYTDKSIIKIAMDNGFSNLAGFNRTFKEIYKQTPAEYREEMQKKAEKPRQEENSEEILERVEQYLTRNKVNAPEEADLTVSALECDVKQEISFEKNWKRMINIGPAEALLQYDVREQLLYLKSSLGFEYVRFWNFLSDEMMIFLDENKTKFNFTRIDKIFDFLVQNGIRPYIEMGFKAKEVYQNVHKMLIDTDNKYQLEIIEKNKGFLEELILHLVMRYGVEEVKHWYVELEKNSIMRAYVEPEKYFNSFEIICGIFKTYVPEIRVGGAGFCLNYPDEDLKVILEKWKKRKIQPDFISLYSYPYIMDEKLLEAGRNSYASDRNYLRNQIQEAREIMDEAGFSAELHVTEWSNTLSNRNVLNDGCYKGAYVMRNLIQNTGEADLIGYWLGSDLFSDYYDTKRILHGGCGLLTKDGIRKPAYYALRFLASLGSYFLGMNENAIVTYTERKQISICCHNYKHFNFRYYLIEEDEIEIERQAGMYEDNEKLQMTFRLKNLSDGKYQVKICSVNEEFGNIQTEWKKMGYYNELTLEELNYLRAVSQPNIHISQKTCSNGVLLVETTLSPQEIQRITVTEMM